jgi:dolichol-phosphate mannosyltransferase
MKVFVLLPAYNEEASIPELFPKLRDELNDLKVEWEIVICNDGSRDRTLEVLEPWKVQIPLTVINHKINRGLGETMRDLYEYAAEKATDEDVIVRMDCDDTHEPKYIAHMLARLAEGCDVVTASRFQKGGGQHGLNAYRTTISSAANLFMKCVFPMRGVREYSCGYRAYRASTIITAIKFYGNQFIQLKGLGFTGTLEKLVKLNIMGARFGEVPFQLRYDQKLSESKMVSSITTLGYLVMAVCYHWPSSGWRSAWGKRWRTWNSSHPVAPPVEREQESS